MYLLALLAVVHWAWCSEDEQIYCAPRYTHLCQGKGQHVGCQFPVAGSGPNCQNYTKIHFTADLRNYVTLFINKRRQRIAAGQEKVRGGQRLPAPKIMMHVSWDFELARLAQRLADQCYFVHDECRATVRYPYAGQTVGEVRWRHLSNSEELSAQRGIRRVFDAWWGERRRVEAQQLTKPFRITDKALDWGHFSQIAVWTLRAVGCGAVRHGEDYPRLLLVCDFSHTNMLGERTLNPGQLEPCPERTRRKAHSSFPLLCAPIKEQVKQSRVIEDDSLDESEYGDEEDIDDNPEILAAREELKGLARDRTRKPKHKHNEDETWEKRLSSREETFPVEDTTEYRKLTTTGFYDDLEDGDVEDFSTSIRAATKTPVYKKLNKNLKNQHRAATEARNESSGKKILIDEEEYRRLSQQSREKSDEKQGNSDEEMTGTISPSHKNGHARPQKQGTVKYTNRSTTTEMNVIQNYHLKYNPRQRWKPQRERPQRPGAAALLRATKLVTPVEKMEPAIPPKISFKMDAEDVAQLHADTGFKPSWHTSLNKTLKR